MTPDDRWSTSVGAFIRQFAARAPFLDEFIANLEPAGPWTDPDHSDALLDAAYRDGIVPKGQRVRRPR